MTPDTLGIWSAPVKALGDEPPKRSGRRAAGSTTGDTAASAAPAAVEPE